MYIKFVSTPLCAAGVLCAIATAAHATPVVSTFDLSNHPGGNAAPPAYGLRFDGMFGGNALTVFSFVDVQLTVTDNTMDAGDISMRIHGLVEGGEVSDNAFSDPELFTIDFNYVSNVETYQGGWRVVGTNNEFNTGTIAPLNGDPEDVFTVVDNDNNAFIFAPDGHRLPGDDATWVGRGWLTTNMNGHDSPGTQDFLFVGTPVPTPGSATLLAISGFAATRRRRQR